MNTATDPREVLDQSKMTIGMITVVAITAVVKSILVPAVVLFAIGVVI